MKIKFTPQFRFDTLELYKSGDLLKINGEDFDFSPLPDGYIVETKSAWIIGPVARVDGELQITIACPTILDNVVVTAKDGEIEVPTDE
ncbi:MULTISPECIES: hypothetical protein [Comamonas]|uniref:Uncharacterized protein n=1 Tax=Comamonas terrigena TaxID=32013 RepID=A0A2A7UWY1_COMTR|nr:MULTISPECIES: hypothetical protein [Comamonas]MBD9531336.1 hypothetical protein [Comamonas sp. CMM01]PEH89747.1 hypothetical protein CRM82_15090 [Comamonas terrigena]BBL24971.1 hypothetical protein CT3_24260 [Comamonas terrigena NBRC 13299]SUY71438.1 Uncharacterised protein [Comamonas terrigena]